MSKRMKGFTCCGDCIHYNYKKHKCNLGASIKTSAIEPFYDDCPIPDIPSDKEIRSKVIDEFAEKIKNFVDCGHLCSPTELRWSDLSVCEMIDDIAEKMKEVRE